MSKLINLSLLCLLGFLIINSSSVVLGVQQRIDELPVTNLGTAISIIFNYPDSPFSVDQYFESSYTFQVKSFGEGVAEIFVQNFYIRLSINSRVYSYFNGPYKIVSPDESEQKTFGFYLIADEVGLFPGQFAGARLEYQMRWTERLEAGTGSEYETDWRLVDYIRVQNSLLPRGVTGPTTPAQPIFGFEILSALAALFILIWIQKKRRNVN